MISRRSFVRNVSAALPIAALPTCAGPEGESPRTDGDRLDAGMLRALAGVLLPAELGTSGLDAAASGFADWVGDYRPAAEREHGYGTDEIGYTPPHPGPGWAAQLDALDLEARQRWGMSFTELDIERRTGMVRATLSRERGAALPSAADAHAVALGFLAWFYASPGANDLCHGASIRSGSCRPLADVAERPAARAQAA